MKTKRIFILGAGLMQKPAIEAAKKLGLETFVADGNSQAAAKSYADFFYHIDLKNRSELLACALKIQQTKGLDAIFTAGTDFSGQVSFLAEKCKLPAHSYEAALNATDKCRMRQCFLKNHIPSPAFVEFNCNQLEVFQKQSTDATAIFEQLALCGDFPLVVKPVDNMGGRGCRMVYNRSELCTAIQDAISYSRSERAIVESYMDGKEFSIDSLIYKGKLIITGFADRHIYYPPYFIEMGHTLSTDLDEKNKIDVITVFEKGVHALGLTHGACKGDIKLTSRGAMIGEIAARLSGGYMSGWTFPYAANLNVTEQAIYLAFGEKPPLFSDDFPLKKISPDVFLVEPENYSSERAWISIPGKIIHSYGISAAEKTHCVQDVFRRSFDGDSVCFPQNNVEKCGNILTKATTRAEAVNAAETAIQKIILRLECPNDQTDAFLQTVTDFPPSAYCLNASICKKIEDLPENRTINTTQPLVQQLPDFLIPFLDTIFDWNKKSMRVACTQFSNLCEKELNLPIKDFLSRFIRGGLQGILYYADNYVCEKDVHLWKKN